jgi:predicted NBD/HSP70 family sugar kinase
MRILINKPVNNYEQDYKNMVNMIQELADQETIEGISIGIGAPINEEETGIFNSYKFSDWVGKDVVGDLENEFNTGVVINGDAENAAISQGMSDVMEDQFLFFGWGTGIGACYGILEDDDWMFLHSEAGHMRYGLESRSVEDYCGGKGIMNRFNKLPHELNEEEWATIRNEIANVIFNMINTLYVPTVVFGGGVALKQQEQLNPIIDLVNSKLEMTPKINFQIAHYGENAGLIGGLGAFE